MASSVIVVSVVWVLTCRRHTDRHTDADERLTPVTVHGVSKEMVVDVVVIVNKSLSTKVIFIISYRPCCLK